MERRSFEERELHPSHVRDDSFWFSMGLSFSPSSNLQIPFVVLMMETV
jgi:hypothetical protein